VGKRTLPQIFLIGDDKQRKLFSNVDGGMDDSVFREGVDA
jgi:hypothetical protein